MIISHRCKFRLSTLLMITILCHFGIGHGDVSDFVLCFGSDGHVAVEHAGHVHHSEMVKSNSVKTVIGSSTANKIGEPCVDVPVVSDEHGDHVPLTDFSKNSIDLGILPLFLIVFFIIQTSREVPPRRFSFDPLFTDSRILSLRSTVLLN